MPDRFYQPRVEEWQLTETCGPGLDLSVGDIAERDSTSVRVQFEFQLLVSRSMKFKLTRREQPQGPGSQTEPGTRPQLAALREGRARTDHCRFIETANRPKRKFVPVMSPGAAPKPALPLEACATQPELAKNQPGRSAVQKIPKNSRGGSLTPEGVSYRQRGE